MKKILLILTLISCLFLKGFNQIPISTNHDIFKIDGQLLYPFLKGWASSRLDTIGVSGVSPSNTLRLYSFGRSTQGRDYIFLHHERSNPCSSGFCAGCCADTAIRGLDINNDTARFYNLNTTWQYSLTNSKPTNSTYNSVIINPRLGSIKQIGDFETTKGQIIVDNGNISTSGTGYGNGYVSGHNGIYAGSFNGNYHPGFIQNFSGSIEAPSNHVTGDTVIQLSNTGGLMDTINNLEKTIHIQIDSLFLRNGNVNMFNNLSNDTLKFGILDSIPGFYNIPTYVKMLYNPNTLGFNSTGSSSLNIIYEPTNQHVTSINSISLSYANRQKMTATISLYTSGYGYGSSIGVNNPPKWWLQIYMTGINTLTSFHGVYNLYFKFKKL